MESSVELPIIQEAARTTTTSATGVLPVPHAVHARSQTPTEENRASQSVPIIPSTAHLSSPTGNSSTPITATHQSHPPGASLVGGIYHPPGNESDSLIDNFPPPLPIPQINLPTTHQLTSSSSSAGSYSLAGSSSDSLISQLAGVSAIHGQIARSNSRGSDSGHGKKRTSPEKTLQGLDQRAIHGLGLASNHPRLKVEDALGYLDRVKGIFVHRPTVYNDFLDIMKEFKSQSLDTPGVITRVASLFKGHPDLIVGFNAFLPHGYKIDIDSHGTVKVTIPPNNQVLTILELPQPPQSLSIPVLDTLTVPPVSREKSQSPTSTVSADSDEDNTNSGSIKMDVDGPAADESMVPIEHEPHHQLTQMDILYNTANCPKSAESESGRLSSSRSSAPTSKGVEFDYAINYVNKIKGRFNDQPQRYKRFLEILHAYQGKIRLSGDKPLDETDVYKEVGRLFGDHPDLMTDFSRFLPNACATMAGPANISEATFMRSSSPSRSESSSPVQNSSQSSKPGPKSGFGRPSGRKVDKHSSRGSRIEKSGSGRGQKNADKRAQKSGIGKSKSGDDHGDRGKSRNSSKKFARPLAKEVRNGKIPDILPEGPKKPVGRPAYNSDREKGERSRPQDLTVSASSAVPSKSPKPAFRRGHDENGSIDENNIAKVPKTKKSAYRLTVPVQRKKLKRLLPLRKAFKPTRTVAPSVAFSYATFDDFSLMDRIRRSVPTNVFTVILKTFELYTSRVFTKGKLLEIIEKLLYHKPKLVKEFAEFLQTKAVTRAGGVDNGAVRSARPLVEIDHRRIVAQKSKDPENRMAEIDFKAFEKFTDSRSYRIRPSNLPKQKSSGSTTMDREVLNDKFVSCPIFSEGSQFLISKKNIAEEVMFKCEDEKYEMDMLLAGAEAAIHAMTYKLEQITAAGSSSRSVTWEDAALHRRIILKLYTENAGIIMSHLKKSPACTIPTVLERLKQKHIQWIRVQNSMSEIWMDQARKNASKIGDYKGGTFKLTDTRFLRSRHMVHEMEKLYSERAERQTKSSAPVTANQLSESVVDKNGSGSIAENRPHLMATYPQSPLTIDDVTFFVLRYVKNHAAFCHSDKKQMSIFLIEYLYRCLKIPDTSNLHDFIDSSDDESDDEKSPRNRRSSVPCLTLSSSEDEDQMDRNEDGMAKWTKRGLGGSDDEAGSSDARVVSKRSRPIIKEFPIAPLPWPELCQYSSDIQPLDAVVDESLSDEAKEREKKRRKIAQRLLVHDLFPSVTSSVVLILGNSPLFLFVRYHQILCERFATLHRSFQNVLSVSSGKQEMPAYIVSKTCKPRIDVPVERFWAVFTDRLLKLLDGNIDPISYEEEMREIFRKDAYLSFTLDRLIQSIARQLHHIVAQERAMTVWNYWEEAWLNGGAGGDLHTRGERTDAEKAYEVKVSDFLKDQNCFKITVTDNGRVGFELTDSEEPDDQQPLCQNWKDFVAFHAENVKLDENLKSSLLARSPIFLARHHRLLSRHRKHSAREVDEEDEEEEEDADVTKLSDQEGGPDFSLDDKTWLMSVNIRSQIESDDILGRNDDRIPLTSWLVYKRGAIQTANEEHRRVSQRRTAAFKRYMSEVWTKKALITQEKHKAFLAMMREGLNRYKYGNSVDAPYFVYYVCKSDESENLETAKPYWQQEQEPEHEPEPNDQEAIDTEEAVDTAASETSEDDEDDTETELDHKQQRRELDRKESTEEP